METIDYDEAMKMKTYFNIEIPKRNSSCSSGQEPFTSGSEAYSLIVEGEEGFVRYDYCPACWKAIEDSAEVKDAITSWKSVIPDVKQEKELFLSRDEAALALFKKIASSELEEERQQAYILSLFLARRRRLYQRKEMTHQNGILYLVYEFADTEEAICIQKYELSNLPIENIQKIIANKLKGC